MPALALAGDESTSFTHKLAQGKFFLEQGMNAKACAEFADASEMPLGKADPEVHALLAECSYLIGDVGAAVDAVRTAKALTDGPAPEKLAELHEFLTTRFGKILVIGAGSDGASVPEPAVPILDPPLKRAYSTAISKLEGPATGGSTSIWLPVGTYRVGGLLVEVRAQSTARMDLRGGVGAAGGGVYGERVDSGGRRRGGGRSGGGRGEAPVPPDLSSSLVVRVGGAGFSQQGNASGGGRLLVGWEAHLPTAFGFRAGGGIGASRAERVHGENVTAPPAARPFGAFGLGGLIPIGPLTLAPWATFEIGSAHPLEPLLPDAYLGPLHYVVFGPDVEVRLMLPTSVSEAGVEVTPEFTVRMEIREWRPVDDPIDPRPHLSVGGGVDVGLRIGSGS